MSEEEKAIERFKKEKNRLDKISYVAEEKKAIDFLKNDVIYWLDKGKDFVVIDIGYNENLHSILKLIEKQRQEIEKYKRYFKLAISDLQSEGYMQMPYKDIEKYYSKREDIV